MIGPGIAALTGLYLLTVTLGSGEFLQRALGLTSQNTLLATVAYLVSAVVASAAGVALGRRFLTGVSVPAVMVMIVGVLVVAFAAGTAMLLGGEVLSGLGAGGVAGATAASAWRTGRRRGAVIAVLAGLGALALIAGPFLGRALAEVLAWRWAYLIAVPFLLLGLIVTAVAGVILFVTRQRAQASAPGVPYPHPQAGPQPWSAPPPPGHRGPEH